MGECGGLCLVSLFMVNSAGNYGRRRLHEVDSATKEYAILRTIIICVNQSQRAMFLR